MKSKFLLVLPLALMGCTKVAMITADPKLKPDPLFILSQKSTGEDPKSKDLWNYKKIGLDQIPSERSNDGPTTDGYQTRVAIIGTGIDYLHEDLAANMAINLAEKTMDGNELKLDHKDNDGNGYIDDILGYDFVDDDGLPYDGDGVDTQAAGIIGAVSGNGIGIHGIAEHVSLLPIRYIDSNGLGTIARLQQALEYAAISKIDVAYLHLLPMQIEMKKADEMTDEEYEEILIAKKQGLESAIGKLSAKGIPVIVNAGTSKRDLESYTNVSVYRILGQFPNVIFVTSVDQADQRPLLTNVGTSMVALAAPGKDIFTTLPGNNYGLASGTHLAAAHVAGAVALVYSKFGGHKPALKIAQALKMKESGDDIPGYDTISGTRLNVTKLMQVVATGNF